MGNIAYKQHKTNHLSRLAQVELLLCFHPLDRLSRLRLSRTCRTLLQASQSTFAWKYLPPIDLTIQFPSDHQPPPIVDAPISHSLLRFCGTNLMWKDPEWRLILTGDYVIDPPTIKEIAHVREYPNVQSLTINRRHMIASQLDALLLENDNLSPLRTFIFNQVIPGEIDFIQKGATFLTFKQLSHLVLPHVRFTYTTYHAFMTELPELTSCGFTTFRTDDWTNEQIKSANEFEFTSRITRLHIHSIGMRHQQPSSIALVNHLLSHVSHLTLSNCFFDDAHDQDFALFVSALTSVRNLITHEDKSKLYRLLTQLTRFPAAAPGLSQMEINSSMHYPPEPANLLILLHQRPNIQIQFRPFYCDAYTHEKQRRCHRHFAGLESGPHANRFQLILPKPEPFWKSFQWPGIPQ